MQGQNRTLLVVLIIAAIVICCWCAIMGGVGAVLVGAPFGAGREQPDIVITRVVTRIATPAQVVRPTATPSALPIEPAPQATAPAEGVAPAPTTAGTDRPDQQEQDELATLSASEMPPADPRVLAMQLNPETGDIPEVVTNTAPQYAVGDRRQFWVSNTDTQEHSEITAELKYLTDVVAMWVEVGVRMDQNDLEASARRFTEKTYPTNREFFGSEWNPGVDSDPRLHILHARNMGDNVAGYYSSADQYSQLVNPYSNEREMFYIAAQAGNAPPNTAFYDGTLAHEFQHMIHWANDRNETSWVNEGMSELASQLNGYDVGGHDLAYMQKPDTQLTTWADPSEESVSEHYGASYLFMSYFLDRFGEDLTKAVVASDKNGAAGFDEALQQAGRAERFEDIFADWVIANYLDAPEADAEGRYGYKSIDLFPVSVAEEYRRFPAEGQAQVSQYGVDYIRLTGDQPLTIRFQGAQQAQLVNAEPQGTYSWWSNRGDQSNSTLTRPVDLRNASSATLEFSAWYEIEDGWDYAYVEVSTDGGTKWQILEGQHTTEENPVGNAFGPGWTGVSGGGNTPEWVDERVDLSRFVGQEILLRFEMVTDDAVNKPGMMIDNLRIPEIGWQDDGESGDAGWTSAGWILTDNSVAQRWLAQLLKIGAGTVVVERLEVGPDGTGEIRIGDMDELDEVMLMISALAPLTTEKARYSYTIDLN